MTVALNRGLQDLGWVDGRNVRIDMRLGSGTDNLRRNIAALVALAPDAFKTVLNAVLVEVATPAG